MQSIFFLYGGRCDQIFDKVLHRGKLEILGQI